MEYLVTPSLFWSVKRIVASVDFAIVTESGETESGNAEA